MYIFDIEKVLVYTHNVYLDIETVLVYKQNVYFVNETVIVNAHNVYLNTETVLLNTHNVYLDIETFMLYYNVYFDILYLQRIFKRFLYAPTTHILMLVYILKLRQSVFVPTAYIWTLRQFL